MQVLTVKINSELEELILKKLSGYSRPVKTKHLAERLDVERADLVGSLNGLRQKSLINYVKETNTKEDHRGREDISYGWVKS